MNEAAKKLIEAAVHASRNAYAPYSKFHVGAALLTSKGEVIVGCNVETAAYGLPICAVRNPIFAAVARKLTSFRAVAVVADGDAVPFPCGACRQVLSEFCGPATPIYIASIKKPDAIKSTTMGELLPHAFKFGQ